jgi:light-regulated signal transduction histidine kinase (bacteriophytochrome)
MIRQTDAVDTLPDDGILSVLAAATDDILWLFTADWETVVFMNDAYEDIWERPLAVLKDDPRDFMQGVHPDDRPAVREMMERVSDGEQVDIEIRVNDSEFDRWVQIQSQPVTTEGEVTYVAGFTRDVTERREREQDLEALTRKLERSNEELQQFAYIASHDLQEPLRMVRSYMSLLDSEYGDELDEEAREYIGFAVDGAQRMKALIEGLLEYSRVETRGGAFEQVDANDAVEAARQALAIAIEDADATIETEPLPTVTGDREQLGRAFQNLISNAIEYTEDGPPVVEIRGDDRGSEYVFAVEDNGVGFPEGNASEMFDIFQRGPDADNGGTGIGLAITKRIVERHGGDVWVESTPEGSTVYLSLAKAPGGERGSDS